MTALARLLRWRPPPLDVPARREVLMLTLGALEACWLAFIFRGIGYFSGVTMPLFPGVYWLGMIICTYLARGLFALHLQTRYERGALILFVCSVVLAEWRILLYPQYALFDLGWLGVTVQHFFSLSNLIPAELMLAFVGLIVCARGFSLAEADLSSHAVAFRFRIGILLLAAVLLAARPSYAGAPIVFAFFFLGLCAVALARLEDVTLERGAGSRFGWPWLGAVAGGAGVVLLLASGLATLFTGDSIMSVLNIVLPILAVPFFLLSLVLYVILLFLSLFGGLFEPLIAAIVAALQALSEVMRRILERFSAQPDDAPWKIPINENTVIALSGGKGLLGFGLLALIIVVIVLGINVMLKRRPPDDEQHEALPAGDLLANALRNLLARGRERLAALAAQARRLSLDNLRFALTVRHIYTQMTQESAHRGFPRAEAETPLEFRAALARAFPTGTPAIECITQAYIIVRYGEIPETPTDLATVRTAWETLRALPPPT